MEQGLFERYLPVLVLIKKKKLYNNLMNKIDGLSMVIPCFNEAKSVKKTIEDLHAALISLRIDFEIIFVDDNSEDESLKKVKELDFKELVILKNDYNLGYGATLKEGIKKSRFSWIGICDADGTYPVSRISDMYPYLGEFDMVIGVRTGDVKAVPLLRRPAKWFLNKFSSFLAMRKIKDVNSGFRFFRKDIILKFWKIFPSGFSFSTTSTLLFTMENMKIKNIPTNYFKRVGKSKIRPIRDTYNFFLLILRITMLFNPLRIFIPTFFSTLTLSLVSLGRDIYLKNLTDTTVLLFVFSLIIILIGLLADLINRRQI